MPHGARRVDATPILTHRFALSLYQHRLFVLPSNVASSWAGYAQVGSGSACWAMVATCDRGDVYAHELGHNLGMWHPSFDADNHGAVGPTCPWGRCRRGTSPRRSSRRSSS